ncbi:hypothetical protein Athai_28750 [Actinocatenispora thailandica]|uniref:Uncharacterized protein n=1 Tax=Actinocatenispora thailandica TaxID=227318 RepID=A0A7R7DPY5_9ACTN|nr:hypothetical protein Athai_28750 [Actinocatenispora thailandica]
MRTFRWLAGRVPARGHRAVAAPRGGTLSDRALTGLTSPVRPRWRAASIDTGSFPRRPGGPAGATVRPGRRDGSAPTGTVRSRAGTGSPAPRTVVGQPDCAGNRTVARCHSASIAARVRRAVSAIVGLVCT